MTRRSRSSGPRRVEPNLLPLLDVVLQLITFFMMLVHFSTRLEGETRQIRLPVAAAALPIADLNFDRLSVAIDARGQLLIGDAILNGETAARWWIEQGQVRFEALNSLGITTTEKALSTQVIVRADQAAHYADVREMLSRAQAAGFARFSLVVLKEGRP